MQQSCLSKNSFSDFPLIAQDKEEKKSSKQRTQYALKVSHSGTLEAKNHIQSVLSETFLEKLPVVEVTACALSTSYLKEEAE